MSRKSKVPFNGINISPEASAKFTDAITSPVDVSATRPDAVDFGRWFFLQNSAPGVDKFDAYLGVATAKWHPPFIGFWSTLAVRHRAIQLASSIRGQEFVRWLAVASLDLPIGPENASFLSQAAWFAPLTESSLLIELAMKYVDKLTSLDDANCHVLQRDLMCYLPTKEGGTVTDPAAAQSAYPVCMETIGELQVWATASLFHAHESLLSPHVFDTRALEIEQMRAASVNLFRSGAIANPSDRVAVARANTLARRATLSRSAFFLQATKRGLDHDKQRSRA